MASYSDVSFIGKGGTAQMVERILFYNFQLVLSSNPGQGEFYLINKNSNVCDESRRYFELPCFMGREVALHHVKATLREQKK